MAVSVQNASPPLQASPLWEQYLLQQASKVGLTSQQQETFILIFGQGKSRQEISELLDISHNACQQCLGEIYGKFQITSKGRGKEKLLSQQLRKDFNQVHERVLLDLESFKTTVSEASNGQPKPRESTQSNAANGAVYTFEDAYQWLEQKAQVTGIKFKPVDQLILRGAWQGLSYKAIARGSKFSPYYLQNAAGAGLWKQLATLLSQDVNKRNLKTVIEAQMHHQALAQNGETTYERRQNTLELQLIEQWQGLQSLGSQGDIPGDMAQNIYLEPIDLAIEAQIQTGSQALEAKLEPIFNAIQSYFSDRTKVREQLAQTLYYRGQQKSSEAQLELSGSEDKQKLLRSAASYLHLSLQLQPDFPKASYALAEVYLAWPAWAEADYHFRQASLDQQLQPWSLNHLGYIAIQQQHYEKAEYILTRAFKGSENAPDMTKFIGESTDVNYLKSTLLKNLGWAILAQGKSERYLEAQMKLEAAIELDNTYAAPHCLLAQVKDCLNLPNQPEWKRCLTLASPHHSPEEAQWVKLATQRSLKSLTA
jgi:tetratricopeptide (TPR) repeat protein/DNA-binding CsgD family transcriptional regulator